MTSLSPASKPASIFFLASGDFNNSLTIIGFSVKSRNSIINSVCVPFPAPGAPLSQNISAGNLRFSEPISCSNSCQTVWKISCASLTSRSSIFFDPDFFLCKDELLSACESGSCVSLSKSRSLLEFGMAFTNK